MDENTLYPIKHKYPIVFISANGVFKLIGGVMSIKGTPVLDLRQISKNKALEIVLDGDLYTLPSLVDDQRQVNAFVMHTPIAYSFNAFYPTEPFGNLSSHNKFVGNLGLAEYPYKPIVL